MAVSKIWPVRSRLEHVLKYVGDPGKTSKTQYDRQKYQALADVLEYAENEEKTEKMLFVQGINCNPSTARDQFITVKKQFGKTDGIQAYHGYISFKEQDITPELAQRIGMEFANEVWGKRFQVICTTHLNTKHLHCHFVINSVSFVDGKKLANEEKAWFRFRHVSDRLCEKYGLDHIERPERDGTPEYIKRKTSEGRPTRLNLLKEAVDESIACSATMIEFKYAMRMRGYSLREHPTRHYMTAVRNGSKQALRIHRLGSEYTEESIIRRLRANEEHLMRRVRMTTFQKKIRYVRCRTILKRKGIKKVGGLYGLYLHYCYRLGYLPKNKTRVHNKVSHIFQDDLIKIDKITEEVRFISENNIKDIEQLKAFKLKAEDSINGSSVRKRQLQNEIRRKSCSSERRDEIRNEIAAISAESALASRNIKMCDRIFERSERIEERLREARKELNDQRKMKGKEVCNDGYWR